MLERSCPAHTRAIFAQPTVSVKDSRSYFHLSHATLQMLQLKQQRINARRVLERALSEQKKGSRRGEPGDADDLSSDEEMEACYL